MLSRQEKIDRARAFFLQRYGKIPELTPGEKRDPNRELMVASGTFDFYQAKTDVLNRAIAASGTGDAEAAQLALDDYELLTGEKMPDVEMLIAMEDY